MISKFHRFKGKVHTPPVVPALRLRLWSKVVLGIVCHCCVALPSFCLVSSPIVVVVKDAFRIMCFFYDDGGGGLCMKSACCEVVTINCPNEGVVVPGEWRSMIDINRLCWHTGQELGRFGRGGYFQGEGGM